jgi:hypothetical protein
MSHPVTIDALVDPRSGGVRYVVASSRRRHQQEDGTSLQEQVARSRRAAQALGYTIGEGEDRR